MPTEPHPRNACAGAFSDWLEVNLLPECNARCAWCVERDGYHPTHRAGWEDIARAAVETGATNVILLGGEPLLYKQLYKLVSYLYANKCRVWITTNGSLLYKHYERLAGEVAGVNVSIHDHDFYGNESVTGLHLDYCELKWAITYLAGAGCKVRLNCNLIRGHVDSMASLRSYITFAHGIGATHVRFAELKLDDSNFVNAHELFGEEFGTNEDPFVSGCNHDTTIDGMPVNIRQMCGLQTPHRKRPLNSVQVPSKVLYYDGHLYDGWQCPGGLDSRAVRGLLVQLRTGKTSVQQASKLLGAQEASQ